MNLLALDTSGPVCGVAVLKDGVIAAEQSAVNKLTHSANLLPMIDAAMHLAGLTMQDLDRLAVVVGPGSFTGVRIGISTAKGFAHGANLPCVAVNALEAMAAGIVGDRATIICPIQDARAGQVYGAAFDSTHKRLLPDEPLKLEDYVAKLQTIGERFLFLGDGMPVHRAHLTELLGEAASFAPPQCAFLRPAAVAVLAAEATQTLSYTELMPLYLRAPSVERNRKLVEAAQHGK